MFEVGKVYRLTIWDGASAAELWNCAVVQVSMPLVKFRQHGKELIFNVTSQSFGGAKPEGDDSN